MSININIRKVIKLFSKSSLEFAQFKYFLKILNGNHKSL